MQKLVWQNAQGNEINLTSEPYGITNWEGFSNAGLNIQSQQVPFQDGGVFLDALIEQRELTVTLAMQDNNNLETRYQLRRELIHNLNPKLGEGYLIYTNDYTSKRIKCVPQIPLFENHNSNDSGTPKASLSWTACSPYWEDLEDTEVTFQIGEQPIIKNEGDIPTQIEMDWFTNYVKNGRVTNVTKNQMIQYDGDLTDNLKIDTRIGKKSVTTDKMRFDISNISLSYNTIIFCELKGIFLAGCSSGIILYSYDGEKWYESNIPVTENIEGIAYSEHLDLFVAVGTNGTIFTSNNGINWDNRSRGISASLNDVAYSEILGLFAIVGNGYIYTSPDGITWTRRTYSGSFNLLSVEWSDRADGYFIAVGSNGNIFLSYDGTTWGPTQSPVSNITLCDVCCYKSNLFIIVGDQGTVITIQDGTLVSQSIGSGFYLYSIVYCSELDLFVAVGQRSDTSLGTSFIMISNDGLTWNQVYTQTQESLLSVTYSASLGLFLTGGAYTLSGYNKNILYQSSNGIDWNKTSNIIEKYLKGVVYSEEFNQFIGVGPEGIVSSQDGINWSVVSDTIINLNAVTYSSRLSLYIAVGNNGKIYRSANGETWTVHSVMNRTLTSVIYSDEKQLFVVVGSNGTIYTSANGTSWTSRTSGVSTNLSSVAYGNDLFIAVGSNVILTSENGTSWTQQTGNGVGITYSKKLNLFVCVGYNGAVKTTKDGVSWTSYTVGTQQLNAVDYSETLNSFIAVGNNGTIIISNDGKYWVEISSGIKYTLVAVAKSETLGMFVVTGLYALYLYSVFSLAENRIQNISADSDIGMNLAIGDNKFRINKSDGNMVVRVKYRQKYIGV